MPPSVVTSPLDSVALHRQWNPIEFGGLGLQTGDHVRWVPLRGLASGSGCATAGFTFGTINGGDSDGRARGDFLFKELGGYFLCYRFLYQQMVPRPPPSGWVIFADIRTVVISPPTATPNGTAVGCMSNISITTSGMDALATNLSSAPVLRCTYTTSQSEEITTQATVLSDRDVACTTPSYMTPTTVTIALRFESLRDFVMEPRFTIFDPSSIVVKTAYPRGGWFNYAYDAQLSGSGFINIGDVRCRWGDEYYGVSAWATVLNGTHMRCEKPALPDETRDELDPLSLSIAPNGQCYAQTSASFIIYNSLISEINPIGAPSTAHTTITVLGEGFPFPGLPGARCLFTRLLDASSNSSGPTLGTPLTVRSPTLAACNSPAIGIAGAEFRVDVSLNGVGIEPLKFPNQPLGFTECERLSIQVLVPVPVAFYNRQCSLSSVQHLLMLPLS